MAQQIAASTQQMTASTEEVASTTGDLTERANQQAQIVRAAADDAGKILSISQELASGAVQAADRNASLARAARSHKERLDASTAELGRLTEEVEAGAAEADALALASAEIEKSKGALGGVTDAGPGPGGGWMLRCTIPIAP
jgi:methyl-accepting chemotaxis protein